MARDQPDDRQLIGEVLNGSSAAFKVLIERYQKLVSHMVFRMIANKSDREDLCQEVFIKVYQNLSGFQFDSKLSTWVARIAYNACLNHLEKKQVPLLGDVFPESDVPDSFPTGTASPDCFAEQRDIAARLQAEIEHLPVHFRAVVTMYHLDEMSYEEIAEVTDMPMGTVKSHLFRARKLLKDRLVEKYQLEDIWQ
jgi:RNA polymerase sigma-70 factor (ECF subfamily)